MTQEKQKEIEKEKMFEEFAYQVKRTVCRSIFDHQVNWCGDCYACSNCGKRFITAGVANEALSQNNKEWEECLGEDEEIAVSVGAPIIITKENSSNQRLAQIKAKAKEKGLI